MIGRLSVGATGLLLLTLLAFATPAEASTGLIHTAKAGETYAALADRYYGRRYLERHLRQLNRHREPLPRGTPVMIPTLQRVRVKSTTSVRDFAAEHLQDPERDAYLKALNRLTTDELDAGDSVLVGQSLRHVVRRGETLTSIARTYYRDVSARRLKLLRLYNKMSSARLRPKAVLRIPLDAPMFLVNRVKARATAPAPRPPPAPTKSKAKAQTKTEANAKTPTRRRPTTPARPRVTSRTKAAERRNPRPDKASRRPSPTEVIGTLERAERRLAEGAYPEALATASRGLSRYPKARTSVRVELLRVKAVALVALGRSSDAKRAFERLVALEPKYRLDLYTTSPKVLEVFQSIDTPRD